MPQIINPGTPWQLWSLHRPGAGPSTTGKAAIHELADPGHMWPPASRLWRQPGVALYRPEPV